MVSGAVENPCKGMARPSPFMAACVTRTLDPGAHSCPWQETCDSPHGQNRVSAWKPPDEKGASELGEGCVLSAPAQDALPRVTLDEGVPAWSLLLNAGGPSVGSESARGPFPHWRKDR